MLQLSMKTDSAEDESIASAGASRPSQLVLEQLPLVQEKNQRHGTMALSYIPSRL
jgi:hypothetical protein